MVISDELAPLRLFNEKAEKLLNSRFVKYLQEKLKLSVRFTFKMGQLTTKRKLPESDDIEAFILTFRFFIQKREASSFRNLAKVYEKLPISAELKQSFFDWRKVLNEYFNKKINCTVDGLTPTRRELINTFIYGGLAHADPKLKPLYDKWKADMIVYQILETHFCSVLDAVLRAIANVAEINKKAISEIEKTPS